MYIEKRDYANLLGLGESFTFEELNKAYYKKAKEVHPDGHPDSEEEHWNKKMVELNAAYAFLKQGLSRNKQPKQDHRVRGDKSSVFSTYCCHQLGLKLETAQGIYKRCFKNNVQLSFDEWLKNRLANLKKYELGKEEVMELCKQSIMLTGIPFQQIVNIYECDCEFGDYDGSFSSWVSSLVEVCIDIEHKLDKKNYLSIMQEIKDYISIDWENSFISYLKNKQEIKSMCQELGKKSYEVEYDYSYSNFRGTFKEYLEYNVAICRLCKAMGMTEKESDEYYNTYLLSGYKGSKLEFLKEAQAILPFSAVLEKGYFKLKHQYDNIPIEERPESFIFWVELEATSQALKKSPAQILEQIYINSKEAGYTKSLTDLLTSLGGEHLKVQDDNDDVLREELQSEEMKHTKVV